LKDRDAHGGPILILDECSDCKIVRRLNDRCTSTTAAIERRLWFEGMSLSDDTIRSI